MGHLPCLLLPVPLIGGVKALLSLQREGESRWVPSSVRTRHKNNLIASKEDIFSIGKREGAGRKLCIRFDSLLQLFRKKK